MQKTRTGNGNFKYNIERSLLIYAGFFYRPQYNISWRLQNVVCSYIDEFSISIVYVVYNQHKR